MSDFLLQVRHVSSDIPRYIKFGLDPEKCEEIYNPLFASWFETDSDAKAWVVENITLPDYITVVPIETALIMFNGWKDNGMPYCSRAMADKRYSKVYNGEDKWEIIKWRLGALENDGRVKYEIYKTWPELHSCCNHIWSAERFSSDNHTSFKYSFEIFVNKSSKVENFIEELRYVLPLITHLNDNGEKQLGVFDHFLSEGGNSVKINVSTDENTFYVSKRWGNETAELSIEQLFDWLKENRYYEVG